MDQDFLAIAYDYGSICDGKKAARHRSSKRQFKVESREFISNKVNKNEGSLIWIPYETIV